MGDVWADAAVAARGHPSVVSSKATPFGIGSIVGIALGVYALNQIAVSRERGRCLAFGGIPVGALTLLLSMIGIVMGLSGS